MTLDRPDIPALFAASDDDVIEVGIGEFILAEAPKRLLTPALGSCVGVALWDPFTRRGGLAHVMLPSPMGASGGEQRARFADFAVPEMVRNLRERGALSRRLQAKVAGGAAMFRGDSTIAGVGDRNVAEVKRQLELMSIPIVAENTGEAHARTVELVLETGEFIIRSYQFGVLHL